MQKVFLSYSSQDRQAVDQLAQELSQQGVSYWRDQDKLYAGHRWPKELGEAIAVQDALLLIWSKHAETSEFVELEWCTAMALKKPILPCRLDDTPLPKILASVHTVHLQELSNGLSQIRRGLNAQIAAADSIHQAEVVEQLSYIASPDPQQVLQSVKTVFNQRGWMVFENPISPERQAELTLLRRVRHDWIEGVLNTSLHRLVQIELGKSTYMEAIEHPLRQVVDLGDSGTRLLPVGTTTLEVFEQAEQFLLILGEPGCGKTISLLDLARSLIARSFADPTSPIPVVFNLSTWAGGLQSLMDCLVDELSSKYQIGKRTSRSWLVRRRLFLLLDGLDEAKESARASCIEAINKFIENTGVPGIVVCSRLQEYEDLPVRLRFRAAIRLLPLTDDQIGLYLDQAAPRLEAVRALIQSDESLRSMARSPLMLNIMSMTYKDDDPSNATRDIGGNSNARVTQLFTTYIERMFSRKGSRQQPYSNNQVLKCLSWLAQRMLQHSQTLFLIDGLQPDWLSHRGAWWFYWIGSRLAWVLVILLIPLLLLPLLLSLPLPLSIPTDIDKSLSPKMIVLFLGIGMITGIIDGRFFGRKNGSRGAWSEKKFILRFFIYSTGYLPFAVIFAKMAIDTNLAAVANWAAMTNVEVVTMVFCYGIIGAAAASYRSLKRSKNGDVRTVAFGWSWKRAERGFIWGITTAIVWELVACTSLMIRIGMPIWLLISTVFICTAFLFGANFLRRRPSQTTEPSALSRFGMDNWMDASYRLFICSLVLDLFAWLYLTVFFEPFLVQFIHVLFLLQISLGLYLGLIGGSIGGGIHPNPIVSTIVPNQGMKSTLVGILSFLMALLCIAAPIFVWVAMTKPQGSVFIIFNAAMFALLVGLWYGTAVIRHFILRVILFYLGYAPRHYIQFLDYAASLIFLQKVGGGYIFIHRLVMEHFASLQEVSPQHPVSSSATELQEYKTL